MGYIYRKSLFVLAFGALFMVQGAHFSLAQSPDTEPDGSSLETYVPPPMFGMPRAPYVSRRLGPDLRPYPEDIATEKTGPVDIDLSAEEILEAPVPDHKPPGGEFSASRVSKSSQAAVAPGAAQPFKHPPLPPRRPDIMNAGPDYTARFVRKSEQSDVPAMPAVPAGKVDAEVLYRAPTTSVTGNDSVPGEPDKPDGEDADETAPLVLLFDRGEDSISDEHIYTLTARALPTLLTNGGVRATVSAYALPADESRSSARRVSLNRALAVRTFLIDKGIDPERLEVQALGSETDREPVDRVDIVFSGGAN